MGVIVASRTAYLPRMLAKGVPVEGHPILGNSRVVAMAAGRRHVAAARSTPTQMAAVTDETRT